jgi:uncharacterized protein YbaP (TraB family)
MKKVLFVLLAVLGHGAAVAQNSILWEISGNGLPTSSYLMGTLKFIGEKEFFLPKEAVKKLGECKTFAIEDQVDHKAQLELNKAVHFPAGKSLATELSPEEYKRVTDFFMAEFKIPKSKFDKKLSKLTPLALSISMTRMSLGENVKYYDIELLELAKENKMETYSLEPIARESQAIQTFPMKEQEAALLHSVSNFEKQKSEYHKLEVAYLRGDLDKVFEYSLHPTENNPVFIEEFYSKRNEEWFPKIEKMMSSKPSFIAVGVSHLEGPKGLLNLLKDKGYTLTPIQVSH